MDRASAGGTGVDGLLLRPAASPSPSHDAAIAELLRRHARLAPDRPVLLAPGTPPMRYRALLQHVEATARSLTAMGVGRGDRVAVVLRNGPEMAACFLGVGAIAACAPLNPAYRAAEFDFYLKDLQPRLVIVERCADSPVREVAAQHGIPLVEIGFRDGREAGSFDIAIEEGVPRFASGDEPALVLHTSGTTSRPKMVALSHANLLASARQIADSLALTEADRCLNVMPLFHIHGLAGATLSTLSSGGSLACTPGFHAAAFFDWLEELRPTWYTAVPTMHQAVLARAAQLPGAGRGTTLRFIRSCSASLPPRVMAELEALFDVPVIEAYGMTEAAHQMASNPLPPLPRKPGSVGLGTGTEIRILGPDGKELPRGETGEIVIRGPGVMRGYVSPPEANADAFAAGWFRTGDQGRLDADGYLFIEGRTKEIINRGGEKISPREVDEALLEHPAVAEALAFSLPDPRLGEDVGAAIVLRKEATTTEAELRAFVAERLADFKVPRRIVFLDAMPKGATGKPQRIGLAAKLGIEAPAPAPQKARRGEPRTPLEAQLARIWAEALRLGSVGIYDDFFDLGGDSQAGVEVAVRVAALTGRAFSITDLVNAPTIAEVSALLSARPGAVRAHDYVARIQPSGSQPPLFVVAGGPLQRDLARLLGPDQPVLAAAYPEPELLPHPCEIADIAAFHATTIRKEQPKGPYRLAGWCVDGIVAYEVAQQLRRQGEEVELLVLFDALNDPLRDAAGPLGLGTQLGRLGRKAAFHLRMMLGLKPAQAPAYLAERLETVSTGLRRRVAQARLRAEAPAEGIDFLALEHAAAGRYRPLPYDGRVLVLRRALRPAGEDPDGRLGWSALVRDLEVHTIPGDHRDMFLEPHVRMTAEVLGRALRRG